MRNPSLHFSSVGWAKFRTDLDCLGVVLDDFSFGPDPELRRLYFGIPHLGVQGCLSAFGSSAPSLDRMHVELFWLAGDADAISAAQMTVVLLALLASAEVSSQHRCGVWLSERSLSPREFLELEVGINMGRVLRLFPVFGRDRDQPLLAGRLCESLEETRGVRRILVTPVPRSLEGCRGLAVAIGSSSGLAVQGLEYTKRIATYLLSAGFREIGPATSGGPIMDRSGC